MSSSAPSAFEEVQSGVTDALYAVWGSDSKNVWAVGGVNNTSSVIRKWNGLTWGDQSSPVTQRLNGIWGLTKDLAWAVGYDAEILTWNGANWQRYTPLIGSGRTLNAVWGTDATHAWAVGTRAEVVPEIYSFDGARWNSAAITTPTGGLAGISGLGQSAIMAVGVNGQSEGAALTWNMTTWTDQSPAPKKPPLNQVWAGDMDHFWVVGQAGTIVQMRPGRVPIVHASTTSKHLYGVWGSDVNSVWAVGQSGTILKWNGTSWAAQSSPTTQDLYAIWGLDTTNIWIVGANGTILKHKPYLL